MIDTASLQRPNRLKAGDRVAAVTLSWGGPGAFPHRYEVGARQLEAAFGVEVIPTDNALRDAEWIARNPAARAEDLLTAFADPTIAGIVATIGGDDSIRTLPFLDLDVIHGNPKVFLGFSDTTITHCACLRAGLTTFYGPSVMAGFGENGGPFPYMGEAVRRTVFEPEGAVLAIETSEEGPPPVHVARFLRTLAVRGILGMLAAIVFGRPGGAHVAPEEHGAYDDAILGVVRDEQELAELPLVTGVDFGHTDPTWTIPIGAATRVDPGARTITFLGAGVR